MRIAVVMLVAACTLRGQCQEILCGAKTGHGMELNMNITQDNDCGNATLNEDELVDMSWDGDVDQKLTNVSAKLPRLSAYYTGNFTIRIMRSNSSMCWSLSPERRQDAVDLRRVWCHNLPVGGDYELLLYYRYYQRSCDQHVPIHTLAPNPNKRRLTLTVSPAMRMNATLLGARCNIVCDGSVNECNTEVRRTYHVTEEESQEGFRFENLESNLYYCVGMEVPNKCMYHSITTKLKEPVTIERTVTLQDGEYSRIAIFVAVGVTVLCCGIALAVYYAFIRNERLPVYEHTSADPESAVEESSDPRILPEVLLLYSRDCPAFCEVMKAFREVLSTCTGLKVLDPVDENLREEISSNVCGWMMKLLSSSHVKVVLVTSEGAVLRQQAALQSKMFTFYEPHWLDSIFTQALQFLHQDTQLSMNYRRVFPVRFKALTSDEMTLALIAPCKCFILPNFLGALISELRGSSTNLEETLEDLQKIWPQELRILEATVQNMKDFSDEYPNYLRNHCKIADYTM